MNADKPCACGTTPKEILSQADVLKEFARAMIRWRQAGFPLADRRLHNLRQGTCAICPDLMGWRCRRCKCLTYLKAKLLTEHCDRWPRS